MTKLVAVFLPLVVLGACRGEQAAPPSPAAPPPGTSANPTTEVREGASNAAAPAASSVPPPSASPEPRTARTWDFEAQPADAPPAGFSFGRTGSGAAGSWVIKAEPGAPSGKGVLAQISADPTGGRFPLAVVDEPTLRDLRLSVKCRAVSGKVDQACGLVFRYRDENNYYITRANALEGNVRLYHVRDGRRTQLASWSGAVTGNWHELRVEAREDRIQVFWDGSQVIDATDQTFTAPGKIGVWTKADSVTYFDDLTVVPL
ncbi:hypothetical protein WME89_18055 [Sorangium sp. So ce321]|uniref:family 16 glycoside hydrolase n=1 Tax=Sorangium sp. So ce321 TaxID=3133300 RepID=UPI003F606879